jgi:hypothetical protein
MRNPSPKPAERPQMGGWPTISTIDSAKVDNAAAHAAPWNIFRFRI